MTATEPIGSRYRSLDGVVRDEIRRRILSGELPPGVRLVELAIAAELGVSRGPVRAAIRQLESEGFVVVSPRRGASVATTTAAEALECYEVRTALEDLSARLAATRRTDADLARMRAILEEGRNSIAAGQWDDLGKLNNDFHVALATASGNSQLVLLMKQYSQRIAWMFSRSAQVRGERAWAEHAEIVDAVERRESDAAAASARAHIESSRQQFVLSTPIAVGMPLPDAVPPR
ncbi:MAG TPA: GntR family transcriptional regulator [Jatrophihabitans sp.]|nr:GntR family transcriptional regulator [Jatrophihabitans sp.]